MYYPGITDHLSVLGFAVLFGAGIGIYNCAFRLLCIFFRPVKSLVFFLDITFWLTCAVAVYFSSAWLCHGHVRLYYVAAVFLGWSVFAVIFGNAFVTVGEYLLTCFYRIFLLGFKLFKKLFCAVNSKVLCLSAKTVNKFKEISFSGKKLAKTACISRRKII